MSLNLQAEQTKILYLPLKDETLPNLQPHTTLTSTEYSKLDDIKSNTFDVCTGITKQSYPTNVLSQIIRTLKPGGVIMIQIAKETNIKKDLLYTGFIDIESNSEDQITHWTARKPRQKIKAAPLKSKTRPERKIPDKKEDEIVTSYRTTPTSFARFIIGCNDINIEALDLKDSILILPTVSVGNIGQIAMDILLTTLMSKNKIIKIGFINDRNIVSGVGNNGIIPKQKKNVKNRIEGIVNMPIEIYWYKECNLVLIQQRCCVRIGGRSEYVNGLMRFINKYEFSKIIVLTSEYITKRTDFQTKVGVKMVYYNSDRIGGKNLFDKLKWNCSLNDKVKMDEKVDIEDNGYRIIGHGITRKFYDECVKEKKDVIVMCEYSEDGDNTKESEMYLDKVVKLIDEISGSEVKLSGIKKWKHPFSLSFANGGRLPNGIY
eukprot:361403_1